ncbi:hypothetical protein SAMN04487995_1993 [Dyadobacter koreensis]|uniref:Phage integrase SAM-like domain-containing protein n=1 Tax=Dyadobacter koreensis TaxID=408657 RepID=A0A1H6T373_9BACT|nr:hypothetical protein [Dyadobacter koreensis]SEI74579.1 hypothetical protein SAMN04487995_1993 [Dyadobacter koreensis]
MESYLNAKKKVVSQYTIEKYIKDLKSFRIVMYPSPLDFRGEYPDVLRFPTRTFDEISCHGMKSENTPITSLQ